jgi:hypothetical protein
LKPIRFRVAAGQQADAAEAVLVRYLPGLDVRLVSFRTDSVLLAPHLNLALELQYGPSGAHAIFELAGLTDGTPVEWEGVFRWARTHAREWDRKAPSAISKKAGQLDWHLQMCDVGAAWDRLGQPGKIDWLGVQLGQIDTGYTEHPAFGSSQTSWIDRDRARTFRTGSPPGDGVDTLEGPSGGHGTSSGSVCYGHDSAAAYHGVAPRVPVVPVRIDNCVIIDKRAEEFETAVHYLVDDVGVDVINVSMGTFLESKPPVPIARAVDHCYDQGVILVAAAGNVPAPEWPAFPAALPRAISIAGVTHAARPWFMSSYGASVALSAPAGAVNRARTTEGPKYDYSASGGGTTFAAAMTSGAAALWLVAHAHAIRSRYALPWQRIEAFRYMARKTATVPDGWVPDGGFGAGILNVGRLMEEDLLPDVETLERR